MFYKELTVPSLSSNEKHSKLIGQRKKKKNTQEKYRSIMYIQQIKSILNNNTLLKIILYNNHSNFRTITNLIHFLRHGVPKSSPNVIVGSLGI